MRYNGRMRTIRTNELKQKIDSGERLLLLDARARARYDEGHLPGALSMPDGPDAVSALDAQAIPKDTEVIVYCSSETCMASVRLGKLLEEAHYSNIVHYSDGVAGWEDAGLDLEEDSPTA